MTGDRCPFPGVDAVYVINLESRADRRREMAAQLARIGASLELPPVRLFAAIRPESRGAFTSVGARGCFLSHLAVLKDASASAHRSILILEDDLDFIAGYLEIGRPLIERAMHDERCAIFYGGYVVSSTTALVAPLTSIGADSAVEMAHFIGLKQPAIDAVITYLEAMLQRPEGDPRGGPMHVDGAYSWFRRDHPQFGTLLSVPELGHQRPSRTDIHVRPWFDDWPGLRWLANFARRQRRR